MVLNLWDSIKKVFDDAGKFIEKNYNEPFFWIIIFVVLLVAALYVISELADK